MVGERARPWPYSAFYSFYSSPTRHISLSTRAAEKIAGYETALDDDARFTVLPGPGLATPTDGHAPGRDLFWLAARRTSVADARPCGSAPSVCVSRLESSPLKCLPFATGTLSIVITSDYRAARPPQHNTHVAGCVSPLSLVSRCAWPCLERVTFLVRTSFLALAGWAKSIASRNKSRNTGAHDSLSLRTMNVLFVAPVLLQSD